MRNTILFFILMLMPGCFGKTLVLDKQFAPLTQVIEAPDNVIPSHTITTIDETSYVRDLNVFLHDYPLGSVGFTAVLMHEREHVIRENAFIGGTPAWLTLYIADRNFRWTEEKAGWKIEILYNTQHGANVNAAVLANVLNTNYDMGGRMVSYENAYNWILDVLAGKQ